MLKKLAPAFALVLIVAACGGSSDPEAESSNPTAAPTTTQAVADEAAAGDGEAHTEEAPHDDEAAHIEEAPHEEEAAHSDDAPQEGESAHEEGVTHEDGDTHEEGHSHEEGAAHEEGDAHEETDHEASVDPGDADRVVEIVMTDFAFAPAPVTVAAGETVKFMVKNEGVIEHEFRLTTQHAADEHIASGHEGHDEGGGGHGHDEIVLLVQPGETGTVDVAFHEAGEFEIVACLIPGHFEAGMKATVEYAST